MWRAALTALALAGCAYAQRETCYANDPEPYVRFATQTAYEFVSAKNNMQHNIPNCEPVMFWSLNRHGTHLPSAASIQDLQGLEQFQRSVIANYDTHSISRTSDVRLCRPDVDNLRHWHWKPNHNATYAGDLTSQGYLDTQGIARGWRSRYPRIMTEDPNDYLFKFVEDRRGRNSFQAYAEGIFGQRAATLNIPKDTNQAKLEPTKQCPAWESAVGKNNETLSQVKIFTSKEEFRTMVRNISSRLGYAYNIHNGDVDRMWRMCGLNKAWDLPQPSPWCAAFTKEDLQRLEYVEDLKTYYGAGYGSPLNARLGCAPVADMVNFFAKYVDNPFVPPQPKSMVTFTQSAMLLMTLTAMGAYQDTVPLTGDNYHTPLMQNRKWRTSEVDPFSANLVAVLYRCRDQGEQFRVMFFLNERPVQLDGCAVGLCDWSWVRRTYGHVADRCDVRKFCQSGAGAERASAVVAAMAVLIGFICSFY